MELKFSGEEKRNLQSIIDKLKRLSPQELLSYWINAELDEAETYNTLAEIVREYSWDPKIPKLFEELARESLEHAELLLKEYRRTYGGEKLIDTGIPGIELELSMGELERYIRSGRLGDLISVLMESERMAQEIYRCLAEKSSGKTRELFEHLASIENGHYLRLKALKESLEESGG
ncbi:hypothetical protein A3L08_05740 [Thermococcus pacificus]|uniref:Ferritin-like diiron domain-containing protein n=2 Tax=Thermococcus pacificus TaxID=71998 RepID=A0A218P7U2_9EURY|nr:hypothetical protein A3L08_05740 [Thermococcus pacificus]